jgi:protein phosphatase 1 regulatory subunit 37
LLPKVNLREVLIVQTLDVDAVRNECLDLKGEILGSMHCETLEEVLKRVQFKNINLEATSLDDEGAVALFDMVEYYESATHLNISCNKNIGVRGWQACSRMIKKVKHIESKLAQ